MMSQAILLDLDETLMDRTSSMQRYAACLHRDCADALAPIAVPTIAAIIRTADKRGYRPREALFQDLLQQLPWQRLPAIGGLFTHGETWLPASSVARAGLHEPLTTLHAQGMRLGAAAVGGRARWLCGVPPWPPAHPVPAWQIEALPDLVTLVPQERNRAT
jgi:putative hydrolase of the HAD superfamily